MLRPQTCCLLLFSPLLVPWRAVGDQVLHRYEGDVLPYDPSAGWIIADPCESPCTESLEDGDFFLRWPQPGNLVNYHYQIAQPSDTPPPTLWAEWRFRSNHPWFGVFGGCDGRFKVHYKGLDEPMYMYGDAVLSFSGDEVIAGLPIDQFRTYRFESLDGTSLTIAVDGAIFITRSENTPNGYHSIQFSGDGGCASQYIPNIKNQWDYIRFGTISIGEEIVSTDPPSGELEYAEYAGIDRFAVTFDSANYVYVDDIGVEVTGGMAPRVVQTRRGANGDVDTVEIVLDRPLPVGELTRFIFDDGAAVNVVEYTLVAPPIPAASTWGLALMTLLVFTTGTILTRRDRHPAPATTLSSSPPSPTGVS